MSGMAAVVIQGATKQFGTQIVLEGVTFEVYAGQVVGLVGANGTGKTTLFRLMAGFMSPDLGTVTRAKGTQIGYLPQDPQIHPERSVHDEVAAGFAELLELEQRLHELSEQMADAAEGPPLTALMDAYERVNTRFLAAGGHNFQTRLNEVLGGLGFTPADYDTPMAKLSGGQKCRASLAKVLLQDANLLLLDEPTNHLDIDAVRWLERFLAGHHGGAVVISHDRYLLDRLCDRILELERRRITSYPGNYTNFAETKYRRALTQQRQFEKDAAFIRKERDFIARHLAGQRTKEAQGRRKRLERRLEAGEFVTEAPNAQRQTKLRFEANEGRAGVLLRCEELSMAYGDKVLFRDLDLAVNAGDRLGITGPNGTGKTTLLRHIVGEVEPRAGKVSFARKTAWGYYAQEHQGLDPKRTVVEEIRSVRGDLSEDQARSLLAQYLFTGENVFKPLGALSGGEQSRVRLASLILQGPELLILDEPTNHLDIPSREALERALGEFPGTIITVSHDRYFLDRIVQQLLVIRPEGHRLYNGNYSFYIGEVEERQAARQAVVQQKKAQQAEQRRTQARKPRTPYDHLSIEEIEVLVMEQDTRRTELAERFGDPAVYQDAEQLAALQEEMEAVEAKLADLEAVWEDRMETQ